MCKRGKLWVEKVWAQLNNPRPPTNSLTKLDFHVNVDIGYLVYLHVGHHVVHHNVISTLLRAQRRCWNGNPKVLPTDGRTDGRMG